jgi:predicted O-methyltransferase YrrM
MIKKIYKFILYAFCKLLKKRRLACSEFGGHYELSIISEPKIKSLLNNEAILLFAEIIKKFSSESYSFSRFANPNWDDMVRNESGEHYRLLPAIVKALNAKNVVEIGTFMGASSVAIIENTNANVLTYDLLKWDSMDTYLSSEDFETGRVRQILEDISERDFFLKNLENLINADVVFVDAPKDGKFEPLFWSHIESKKINLHGKVFIFDDIRVSTMHDFWQDLNYPKIDLGSLGHWSGTGLVLLL